jgi:hypothetical protein
MSIDDKIGSLWSKINPSTTLGRIIVFVLGAEVIFYLLLATISPLSPDLSTHRIVPLPGRYHTFFVNKATALFVGVLFIQWVVTLMVLVPIGMAARADEPTPK